MNISFSVFRAKIEITIGTEHLYFSQRNNSYYADYRPKYPEKSAGDLLICYNYITDEAELIGNIESSIATIIKGTFDDIIAKLENSEAKQENDWNKATKAAETLIEKYLAAGGSEKEMMTKREVTFFFLGMLQREGESAVKKFLDEWKYQPRVRDKGFRGYA